jgi:diguanylate cyclase (GGDEF)-like protein/PAS domain S-box-containing protein
MQAALHPLLQRQLRRLGLRVDGLPDRAEAWAELLARVSRAYTETEQDRYLLERSQEIASREMGELNAALQAERDRLESRVRERTEALELSQGRLSSLVSLSSDWIWEQDEDLRFTYFSAGLKAATGVDPQTLIGKRRLLDSVVDVPPDVAADHERRLAARQPFRDLVYCLATSGGRGLYISVSGEPIFDGDGRFRGYRGVGRDVTNQRLAEQQVLRLARYDGLTGLPNRNMFGDELERTLAKARRGSTRFALFFIDLDRFKNINDSLGHGAGDQLLKVMATRLRALLRESDLVARLGGDEFVVLLDGSVEAAALAHVARKALAAIAEPVRIESRSFQVTGSIGISLYPDDGEDAATLLKHADAAMYLAKDQGKNNYQFYTAQLAMHSAQQFALEADLRAAIDRDELQLHYQPKVQVGSGELVGMEALLRWQHPQRGLLAPGEFIALAEDCGLIVPIGRWVLRAACRQVRAWRDAGCAVPRCAVNLSARQLVSETLVDEIAEALAAWRLDADALEVEITESVLMADPERANRTLQGLHALGVHIAIDDFGTGYSSLAYLKRFPAQTVKIDRSFVSGLPDDRDDAAITQAVVAMAHSLALEVVAEGVETDAQLDFLRRLGCDGAQGYLIGRPMPAAQLQRRLPGAGDGQRAA